MIDEAIAFAAKAHAGQRRKYRAVPYIVHPIHVMEILATVTDREDMWTAAVLHDVVEDTPVTADEIEEVFGTSVAAMVVGMTKVNVPGNRAARKAAERDRLAAETAEVHTIKCADVISNGPSILKNDPGFAQTYLEETRLLLPRLDKAHPKLLERAYQMLKAA